MTVAVVGAGIHGLSTALALSSRGHEVDVFEQFEFGHERGSSHGASRIVRKAYPDVFFTELMASAYPMWHDLERAAKTQLLHEVGLLYFGSRDSKDIVQVERGLSEVGVPHEVLDAQSVRQRHPSLRLGTHECAVFTPEAGWVDASAAMTQTKQLAQRRGTRFHFGSRFMNGESGIAELESKFDAFVVAPGAWVTEWVPDLKVRATAQTVAYFDAELEGPVWIEDSPRLAYGFPSDPHLGLKLALHSPGPYVHPSLPSPPAERDPFGHGGLTKSAHTSPNRHSDENDSAREPNRENIEFLADVGARRFGLAEPQLKLAYPCIYTNTPDEDFRWGRLGDRGFFVSACSGHGFKFGPWVGSKMADFVERRDRPESISRFFVAPS